MLKRNLNNLRNDPIPHKKLSKKYCGFCKVGMSYVDHKEPEFLKKFLNPQGKILPPFYTGNCRKHQRIMAITIKRARQLAFLPYVTDNLK